MKKFLILILSLVSVSSFAQSKWSLRVGVLTPIPVDVHTNYKVDVGSGLATLGYTAGKKLDITATAGYLRFQGAGANVDFTNVPVMVGARYHVNDKIYFGMEAGPAFFNKEADVDSKALYSPYLGYQIGHISVDARYFNWHDHDNLYNNMALCVSYKL